MSDPTAGRVTQLLRQWQSGDADALDELLPLVRAELKRQARYHLRSERSHTMAASDLIQEAFIRFSGNQRIDWRDRAHFFGVTVATMRRVLIDAARRRASAKRGHTPRQVSLEHVARIAPGSDTTVLAVHEALTRMAVEMPEEARVVELRYFGGLTEPEIAEALGVSEVTVQRRWKRAKAWLAVALSDPDDRRSKEG